mgnify:CR=1 FL=1
MMKKYLSISFLAVFVLLAFSCEEVPPVLNPVGNNNSGGGGPVSEQKRQVIIEEFTGVRCVNCPAASEAIQALLGVHGDQLVAVAIHAGFFAVPYPEAGEAALENDTGSSLLSLLGQPLGFPTAVVNRRNFEGEENRQTGQSTWAGYIAEELTTPPMLRIDLGSTYNDATGAVDIETDLYVDEGFNYEDVRLTVYITESNVTAPQLTPDGVEMDYKHKHVFRTAVTAFDGDVLNENFLAGTVINRSLSVTLDPSWVAEDCHIVAFVHRGGGTLDVIQAHEIAVVE